MSAQGFMEDLKGAPCTWQEMLSRSILLTSIALGCMVEAVAANGDPEARYVLIRKMWQRTEPVHRFAARATIGVHIFRIRANEPRMSGLVGCPRATDGAPRSPLKPACLSFSFGRPRAPLRCL